MASVPENPRSRMYFPIVMPIDKLGRGPASMEDTAELTWEVWDQLCMSHGSHKTLLSAVEQAEKLNHEYHVLGIKKEHQPSWPLQET